MKLTKVASPGAGAHTIGRAKPSRSGFGKENTSYTVNGPGNPGGSSWTKDWLKFDNSYFKVSPSSPLRVPREALCTIQALELILTGTGG